MSVISREPLSHKEVDDLRNRPLAGTTHMLRLMANYDKSRQETKRAQGLSSKHYQHHVNALEDHRGTKKKLDEAKKEIEELKRLVEEAEQSRCFMIDSAAKSHMIKEKVVEHIRALPGDEFYDGIAQRDDIILRLSKKDFEELLLTLDDDGEIR